jgi:YVTN family beta-propeller protein
MKPLSSIPMGGEINKLAILPNGQKAYVTRTSADSVAVVDTNPLSASYNTVLTTVATGARPYGLAITPDGSRAYVTNNGSTSLSMISTSTDTVTAIPLGSISAPTGIAITVDGKRGYFLSFDQQINILDTDPGGLNYNSLLGSIPRTLLLMGDIAMSPDGKKAVVNWQGTIAHAVDVIDVDSTSSTYNTIIATPVPVVSGVGADVAVSIDSAFAFATDQNNRLCKIDLQSYTIPITNTSIGGPAAIVISPDGQVVLSSNFNSNKLAVIRTTDLTVITELDLGLNLGQHIAITPDGTRAYVERNVLSNSSELVMVPLK